MSAAKVIEVHGQENNEDSQSFLHENYERLSKQCVHVYRLLLEGKRLTTVNAPAYGILSLPRRIADLRESGFEVKDQWLHNEKGKRTIKEWFVDPVRRPTKGKIVSNWTEFLRGANLEQKDLFENQ